MRYEFDNTRDSKVNLRLDNKLILIKELCDKDNLFSLIAAYQILKMEEEHSEEKAVRGWRGTVIVRLYELLQAPNLGENFKKLEAELEQIISKPIPKL